MVEGVVGGFEDLVGGCGVVGVEFGDADADGEGSADGFLVVGASEGLDVGTDSFGREERSVDVLFGEQDEEFFAAVAVDEVVVAAGVDGGGDASERVVACLVSVGVVESPRV